jgi:hypothetical protein
VGHATTVVVDACSHSARCHVLIRCRLVVGQQRWSDGPRSTFRLHLTVLTCCLFLSCDVVQVFLRGHAAKPPVAVEQGEAGWADDGLVKSCRHASLPAAALALDRITV